LVLLFAVLVTNLAPTVVFSQAGPPAQTPPPGYVQLANASAAAASNALASTVQSLAAQAANGNLPGMSSADLQSTLADVLRNAGINPDSDASATALTDAVTKLQKIIDQQQKAQQNQNNSGTGDWVFGKIWPGVAYNAIYPLTNKCHIGQMVNITYPLNMGNQDDVPLTGPATVAVPGNSTVNVAMVLQYPALPPPPPTAPPPMCWPAINDITSAHMQTSKAESAPGGTTVYTCYGTQVTYNIYLCLWDQAPPEQGGGPGKPKKPKPKDEPKPLSPASQPQSSACENLWDFGIFVPSGEFKSPSDCTAYMREQAHLLFDQRLQADRSLNPAKWGWLPTGPAIDSLSVQQILVLKAVAMKDLSAAGH
jgi:hypothetical protein